MRCLTVIPSLLIVVSLVVAYIIQSSITSMNAFIIESQAGKNFIVTGGNQGLGYYTAKDLAVAGGRVIIACRSIEKGEEALKLMREESMKELNVHVLPLDLSDLSSVETFVQVYLSKFKSLDVLINNAGIGGDDSKSVFATNHYGHFKLTLLLLPHMNPNGRIINHSSAMHFIASSLDVKDLEEIQRSNKQNPHISSLAYSNSKSANLLFTYYLNTQISKNSKLKARNIKAIVVHPGLAATKINNFISLGMAPWYGSQSQTYAATFPDIDASRNNYIGPYFISFGVPALSFTHYNTWDSKNQEILWNFSVQVTGTTI